MTWSGGARWEGSDGVVLQPTSNTGSMVSEHVSSMVAKMLGSLGSWLSWVGVPAQLTLPGLSLPGFFPQNRSVGWSLGQSQHVR